MKYCGVILLLVRSASGYTYLSTYPPGCNSAAALKCEYDFLLCKLFNGPSNDRTTLCNCAKSFYGECLRLAGCETAKEVGPLTAHEIYMKTCVDFIVLNNCPDPLICGINCASNTDIDVNSTKVIPFNNYGQYYLRVRTCVKKVHQQKLAKYSTVDQVACSTISDYDVCSRWIPPMTFVPVALQINTTYVQIDSCEIQGNGTYFCHSVNPAPSTIYGNSYLFPPTFDVVQSNSSICSTDTDCLGSFCDVKFHPPICSPKTLKQATGQGINYLTV